MAPVRVKNTPVLCCNQDKLTRAEPQHIHQFTCFLFSVFQIVLLGYVCSDQVQNNKFLIEKKPYSFIVAGSCSHDMRCSYWLAWRDTGTSLNLTKMNEECIDYTFHTQ